MTRLLVTILAGALSCTAYAQSGPLAGPPASAEAPASSGAQPAAPDPSRVLTSAGIPGVVAPGTPTEFLRSGFNGTEGVISLPDGSVLFCELNANKIIHIDLSGDFSTYLEDANRTTGLGFDHKGRLISAQSRDPRIGVLMPRRETLADSFGGLPLVRPNDVVIDKKDGIYFSDPVPMPHTQFRDPPPGRKPLILYITPAGRVIEATAEVAQPNGVQLSPDEKTFYATDGDHLVAFDVQPDGSLRNLRRFADVAGGDGLAVDRDGRVYVATEPGVQIVSKEGQVLGLIPTPVRMQSIGFAGVDHKTLYAVGRGAVYRIRLRARGVAGRVK
jgi:gluconolactonase